MNPEEKQMTETESLQLITSMINKAKNRFNETGMLYLLWGWLILACCVVQFVAIHFFNNNKTYYVWYSTWLLLIYQFFYLRKKKASRKVKMYTGEIIGFVWLVFLIMYALLVFILLYMNAGAVISPAILVMYGMPTFLSGIILKFNPLKTGGICCWLLAICSPFVTGEYQLLLIASAVIIAWIIPGYLLKQKFKKEN